MPPHRTFGWEFVADRGSRGSDAPLTGRRPVRFEAFRPHSRLRCPSVYLRMTRRGRRPSYGVLMLLMLLVLMVTALPVGVLAARVGAGAGRLAPSVAGALLLAIVTGDLVPDALHDGASSDLPGGVAMVFAVVVVGALAGAVVLGRRGAGRSVGCCSGAPGRVAAAALATHGAAEGLVVVGIGTGLGEAAALAVAGVVALHRIAEGFALATTLRRSRTPRVTARGLAALASLSPLLGGALAGVVTLDDGVAAAVTAALAGLLSTVAVSLLAGARRRGPAPTSAVLVSPLSPLSPLPPVSLVALRVEGGAHP